jgi:hypothetical protein
MNKKWKINEENYLKENVNIYTDEEISHRLTQMSGREVTMLAVRKKRQKLGLKKAQGRGYCKLEKDVFYEALDPVV